MMRQVKTSAALGLLAFLLPVCGEATQPSREITYIRYILPGTNTYSYWYSGRETYIKDTLPNEWFPSWDAETLKAGAVIIRSGVWWRIDRTDLASPVPHNNCYQGPNGLFDVTDPNSRVGSNGKPGHEQWIPYSSKPATSTAVDATQYYHAETNTSGRPDSLVSLSYTNVIQNRSHTASGTFLSKVLAAYQGAGPPFDPDTDCSETTLLSTISYPGSTAVDPGTIAVQATLDGVSWDGPMFYTLSGPQFIQGSSTATFSNALGGIYTFSFSGGGPTGASLINVTPSLTQTLVDQGTITYTVNFRSSPQTGFLAAQVNLDGAAWSGGITYQVSGPNGSFNGDSVPETYLVPPGTYGVNYITGGPSNAKFLGAAAAPSQTVGVGATITYTLYFTALNLEPLIESESAIGVGANGAELEAFVNAEGLATNVYFEYGVDGLGGYNTTASSPITAITFPITVEQVVTGLACGTTYTYYAVATNSAGTTYGIPQTFTTLSCPTSSAPSITAESVDGVTGNSAVLFASVSPNGLSTTAYFQYGINPSVSVNGTLSQSISGSVSSASIAAPISGLDCGTNYTYYAIGTNSAGTTAGTFLNFTTWPCVAASPFVTSEGVDGITQTSAVFHGTVIPNGLETYARVAYGTNQSTSLTEIPPPAIDLGSGYNEIRFSVSASGLSCGTTYFYYVIAVNAATGTGGQVLSFTTLPCGASSGASFYTLTPCRILDTRPSNSPISADSGEAIQITGICGIPATATSVALNVTAVSPTSQGILSVYPVGSVPPNYTVAFGAGQTRAASTVIGLSSYGMVNVFCYMPSGQGQTNFLIDVTGYFQ
jgi:Stage II sporulation protein